MPNLARPREAKNPDTLVIFDSFVDAFGRPHAASRPDAPVASEPYTPRLKDCTGLGPNTLKLRRKTGSEALSEEEMITRS